jgi:hypothetical protein
MTPELLATQYKLHNLVLGLKSRSLRPSKRLPYVSLPDRIIWCQAFPISPSPRLSLRSPNPHSRRIGPEIKDEATDTDSESSQRIFQRHQRSHPEKA